VRSQGAVGAREDARRYAPALERGAELEYDREVETEWSGEGRDVMVLTRTGKEGEGAERRGLTGTSRYVREKGRDNDARLGWRPEVGAEHIRRVYDHRQRSIRNYRRERSSAIRESERQSASHPA